MESVKVLNLDFRGISNIIQTLKAVQYDDGRAVRVMLSGTEGNISKVRIYCQKPSGMETYTDGTVVNDYCVLFGLTPQMLAEEGIVKSQLQLMDGEHVVTSFDFQIQVSKNRIASSSITSSNEYQALVQALKNVDKTEADISQNRSEISIIKGRVDTAEQNIDVHTAQIAEMQKIPEGGTTADAALNDIKIGYDGTEYQTPGEAVRRQVSSLSEEIANTGEQIKHQYEIENVVNIVEFEKKYINIDGSTVESTKSLLLPIIEFSSYNDAVVAFNIPVKFIRYAYFDINGDPLNELEDLQSFSKTSIMTLKNKSKINASKFVLQIQKSDLSDWTDEEISSLKCKVFKKNSLYYNFLDAFSETTNGVDASDKAKAFIISNTERGAYDGGGNAIDLDFRVRTSLIESANFLSDSLMISYENKFTVRYFDKDMTYVTGTNTPDTREIINLSYPYFAVTFVIGEENNFSDIFNMNCELINHKYKKLNVVWENGTCYAGGDDAPSDKVIRSNKFDTKEGHLYAVLFPPELSGSINFVGWSGVRDNLERVAHPFSFIGDGDFTRVTLRIGDGTEDFNVDMADFSKIDIREIDIRKLNGVVSISTTESTYEGDIVLDKNNVQPIIQALLSCINESISIKLMDGDFYFDTIYTSVKSNQKSYLMTYEYNYEYEEKKTITLNGNSDAKRTDTKGKTRLFIKNSVSSNDEDLSFLLVPRTSEDPMVKRLSNTMMCISDVAFIADAYTQNFVFVNLSSSSANIIENIEVRADGSTTGLTTFPTKPNENCVGIRVGYGSNNGIQNYVKHCMVYFCGKGFSCSGEHYIFEDDLAHHCYYGFAFGDYKARVGYEHPNIMMGCSIEGCYRLMLLTKNGIMEEGDFVYNYDNNCIRSTLICIGLSTEASWAIPLDEVEEGSETTSTTKPILEILKGAYNGRVELDYPAIPFEEGSGKRIRYIAYGGNNISN